MKKLWCLDHDTKKGWGRRLHKAAQARGLRSALFKRASEVDEDGYAFMRIPQWDPLPGKTAAYALAELDGVTLIPDLQTIDCYDDKLKQATAYRGWMPFTLTLDLSDPFPEVFLSTALDILPFPFVSKGAAGSASQNVRLIHTPEQAAAEIRAVRSREGLPMMVYGKDIRQRGYLIWQDWLPGNDCDYRVHIIGRHMAICKRHCPADSPFASGRGDIENIDPHCDEAQKILAASRRFFDEFGIRFAAIDVVLDRAGEPRVLETSLGWSADKSPWLLRRFDSGRRCADWLNVLLDEIEEGVFDA